MARMFYTEARYMIPEDPLVVLISSFYYFLARDERLELPTPGFGDRCSTN